ncbi:MinD/ParA family protein [Kitasatospora sp. NPDC006697]|uniref:MinD/ParA family ATP-binding protein n=1 Tax=Kitasatospora sp. NPDC006697 TaxID=3364020 RepID=UPI0036758598
MTGQGGTAAVVLRAAPGGLVGSSPDYAPDAWPEPLGPLRPLDPLGTVLIPPAVRAVVAPRPTAAPAAAAPAPAPQADPSLGRAADLELSADRLVRRRLPRGRRLAAAAERLTRGGDREREPARQAERIRTPLRRAHRVAVLGAGPGTGRTVTTTLLGDLLAAHRPDRVIALALGTGTGPVGLPAAPTHQDFRRFTELRPSGLELLASGAADEAGHRRLLDAAASQYPVVLTDPGGGAPAVRAALAAADQLVICAGATVRGAAGTDALLGWLAAEGFADRVAAGLLVVAPVRGNERALPGEELSAHFAGRFRSVLLVPADAHLADGGDPVLDRLRGRTRAAFTELAALTGDAMAD